jgi:hypothetical protein
VLARDSGEQMRDVASKLAPTVEAPDRDPPVDGDPPGRKFEVEENDGRTSNTRLEASSTLAQAIGFRQCG